jgi:outer membrane biosynthesis protein TonB
VKKSNLYGLIGSTLSSTILLLLLWFLVLSVPSSNENEGFQISFGDSFDAGGGGNDASTVNLKPSTNTETASKTKETATETKPVSSRVKDVVTTKNPTNQKVFTQTENSVSIAEQKEKERVSKEQEAIKVQQAETNKRIADQKRKEQEAINKAKSVDGLFGGKGSGGGTGGGNGSGVGKGTGAGTGDGIQGNPAGKGTNGVGFTLNLGNRSYLGTPVKPNYPKDVEGKITVNIRVDEKGVVSSTSIGSPTTISDSEMRKDAMSAANKTRFTSGKNIETGSITYNYRLQ